MPLLKNGRLTDDPWLSVADDADLPLGGHVIVSLDRWRAQHATLVGRNAPLGLRLRSDQRPDEVVPDLHHFDVIALEFPTFRDGRAYSTARRLRERFGYDGEIRAVGNVLRDQWAFMRRCGFDAFEVAGADAEKAWAESEGEIGVFYQPAADRRPAVASLRRPRGGVPFPS